MKFLKPFFAIIPFFFFSLAFYLIHRELGESSWPEMKEELFNWPSYQIGWAIVATLLNFIVLSGYDVLGLRQIRAKISYLKTLKVSFFAFSLSNLVGHSLFSGTSLRMRYYAKEGLPFDQIAQVAVQNTLAQWLGFLFLAGISLLTYPELGVSFYITTQVAVTLGIAMLAIVTAILFLSAHFPERLKSWRGLRSLQLPGPTKMLSYLALAVADLVLFSAVLYLLLAVGAGASLTQDAGLTFPHFLALFIVAQLAGMMSQVPGGIGVFEGVLVALLTPFSEVHSIISSLVLFRLIYYLAPFALTLLGVLIDEAINRKSAAVKASEMAQVLFSPIVAQLLAVATFAAGAVLLFSGVFPAISSRIAWLHSTFPLFVIEFSHLASSFAGLTLLLISFELWGRNRRALYFAQIFLALGITTSLLKGLDYEEAIVLTLVLLASFIAKKSFYRKSTFKFNHISPLQMMAVFVCLMVSLYAGLFAYQEVPSLQDLFLRFHWHGDAERFLRATVSIFALFLFFITRAYLKASSSHNIPPMTAEDITDLERILAQVTETEAQLVWLGDKHLFFSDNRQAFLMYGIQGSSWIVLGDAYGVESERRSLMQKFVDAADREGMRPVFYQLSEKSLALALECGLQVFKLGEEAHIDLKFFSLEGSARKPLRNAEKRGEKDGLSFRIIPVEEVPAILPRLRQISDAWIHDKKAQEKGFSLGFFREDYVQRFACAVVEKDQQIFAFANLWAGAGQELSIDLMRYDPVLSPKGVMDFLFVKILLWGHEKSFSSFNFGMAPLSGLRSNPWGPLWYKLGSFIYRYGEHFYNFQGLRDYKEKYSPVWKMRFIATPGGVSFLKTLTDVTLLIGGGVKGIMGIGREKK
jgi:phosphatidylglycerol lysyltransferase